MATIETGQDTSFDEGAAAEQERIEQAKAELYAEEQGQPDELILGRYRTQEDLVEAYKNLQRENERMRQGQPPDVELESERDHPEQQLEQEPEEEEDDTPSISPEEGARLRGEIFNQAGGQEKYSALMAWASDNIDDTRANAYNQALEQGDEVQILAQLKSIQYDYMMNKGYEPKLTGGRAPSNQIKGFANEAQVVAAMSDPRYINGATPDPEYIREVEERVAASNVFQSR